MAKSRSSNTAARRPDDTVLDRCDRAIGKLFRMHVLGSVAIIVLHGFAAASIYWLIGAGYRIDRPDDCEKIDQRPLAVIYNLLNSSDWRCYAAEAQELLRTVLRGLVVALFTAEGLRKLWRYSVRGSESPDGGRQLDD